MSHSPSGQPGKAGQVGNQIQQVWTTVPRPASWYVQEAKREAAEMARGVPLGLPFGFAALDARVRMRAGQLIVLAARSSMGKTSFALQVAMHNALNLQASWDDGCVVMFSAEMSGAELFQKMASVRSGVNLQRGYAGQWTPSDSQAFNDALDDLSNLPLVINDLNQIKTDTMRDGLKMLSDAGKPARLVVFDYIELGADDDKFKEHERVSAVVHRLKSMARDLNIPVLALSQINRDIEKESRHRLPLIHNLAGSDAVGRTADKVLTMLVPQFYLTTGQSCACEHIEDSRNTAYISVQKDRFGARGVHYRLRFDPQAAAFYDVDDSDFRGPFVRKLQVRHAEDAMRWLDQQRAAAQASMQAQQEYNDMLARAHNQAESCIQEEETQTQGA